jgi:hypothetical protein
MMPSGETESSVIAVGGGLGAQRWMTDVSAKIIHGMTGGDESPVSVTARRSLQNFTEARLNIPELFNFRAFIISAGQTRIYEYDTYCTRFLCWVLGAAKWTNQFWVG